MRKIVSKPPVYFIAGLFATIGVYFLLPGGHLPIFPFNLTGVFVMAGAFSILSKAYMTFKDKGTPEDFSRPACLVEEGIYSRTRNPMYLSSLLMMTGFALCFSNIYCLTPMIIFFAIIQFMFIPYEEERLEKQFGEEYVDYKSRVRQWF